MEPALNGNMGEPVHLRTSDMEWKGSPGNQVWRKRLHRVGPVEAGQVTSVVRYDPGSSFPAHGHPDGEEILVVDGVFSDQQGDFPAGSYLLNPEGFEHAPGSKSGCLLFVKLRQYPGRDRPQLALDTADMPWEESGEVGIERRWLFLQSGYPETMELLRADAGATMRSTEYPGGAEFFVLDGELRLGSWELQTGDWLRIPPASSFGFTATQRSVLYRKSNGVDVLASSA